MKKSVVWLCSCKLKNWFRSDKELCREKKIELKRKVKELKATEEEVQGLQERLRPIEEKIREVSTGYMMMNEPHSRTDNSMDPVVDPSRSLYVGC